MVNVHGGGVGAENVVRKLGCGKIENWKSHQNKLKLHQSKLQYALNMCAVELRLCIFGNIEFVTEKNLLQFYYLLVIMVYVCV